MKTRSAKNKGRKLQNEVKAALLEQFQSVLESDDIQVAIMGESGTDIKLSPLARKYIPYSIECKNQEKISIWAALKQAIANTKEGTQPALVFRRNNTEAFITIRLEHFLTLLPTPPSIEKP